MTLIIDFDVLEKYLLVSLKGNDHSILSIPAEELLHPETMDFMLKQGKTAFNAYDLSLPASLVGNALFGLCGALQWVMAQHNHWIDFPLNNLLFQMISHNGYLYGAFQIKQLVLRGMPSDGHAREEFIRSQLTAFYEREIGPVVQLAAERAGVNPGLIWNQYGARMIYLRDFLLENEPDEQVKQTFLRDYDLLKSLPANLFGKFKNPFVCNPRYVDNPRNPDKPLLLRSSCCMYYNREGGVKCYNCPRLTPEQRMRMQ